MPPQKKIGSAPGRSTLRRRPDRRETARRRRASAGQIDPGKIAHELEVHRVELEMQNRELRDARVELEHAVQRYRDLYDFAPVGYLTLDFNGAVIEANLTASLLLGIPRGQIRRRSLSSLIANNQRASLREHLRNTFRSPEKWRCELSLRRDATGGQIWISLESLRDDRSPGLRQCHTAISDITERKSAQTALYEAHGALERRVSERTKELEEANRKLQAELAARVHAEEALLDSQANLRALASEAALAEQRERKHLASDLHDGLSQLLTLARIKLESVARGDGNGASHYVREVRTLLAQAQQHAESLTFQLSPPLLSDVGLVAAAERLAEDIERTYGLRVTVHADAEHRPADEALRVTVFRAMRELILNAAEHAHASLLAVRFRARTDRLIIDVEDDGVGCDPRAARGFGLSNVRERMAYLGGSLRIEPRPGCGTKATLTVPRPDPLAKDKGAVM